MKNSSKVHSKFFEDLDIDDFKSSCRSVTFSHQETFHSYQSERDALALGLSDIDDYSDSKEDKDFEVTSDMKQSLYVCYFFATVGDQIWSFAIAVIFATIWNDIFLPVAIHQLFIEFGMTFTRSYLEYWCDTMPRRTIEFSGIVIGNICTIVSCALLIYIVSNYPSPVEITKTWHLIACIILSDYVGELFTEAGRINLQKIREDLDELGALEGGLPSPSYSVPSLSVCKQVNLSVYMTKIDLFAKLIPPLLVGFTLDYLCATEDVSIAVTYGACAIILWNIFSAVIELHYASMFYEKNPNFIGPRDEVSNMEERPTCGTLFDVYYESSLFLPALSSSLIFCSILTNFSYIFKAWLIYNGISFGIVGCGKTAEIMFGVLGSLLFSHFTHLFNPELVGLINLFLFTIFMVGASLSFYIFSKSTYQIFALLFTVVTGRTWLWLYHLSISEMIERDLFWNLDVNLFRSAQEYANKFSTLIILIFATIFYNKRDFYVLCIVSTMGTVASFLLYIYWAFFSSTGNRSLTFSPVHTLRLFNTNLGRYSRNLSNKKL